VKLTLSVRHCAIGVLIAAASLPATAAQQSPPPRDAGVPASPVGEEIDAEWTRWTNGRYRITPGDVLEVTFPFVPELNQTVMVQPDGYISLKDTRDVRAQGRTVAQLKEDVLAAYSAFVREPVFTIALKEFEKPYFLANGEVQKPGRYELRGATTLTQAVAIAGGFTHGANTSRVVLYRQFGENGSEARQINVGRMYSKRDLSEDPLLRPGDTIVVSRSVLGKVLPILDIWRW
jgi:protein involved in polysaccharide export with SLBB domain